MSIRSDIAADCIYDFEELCEKTHNEAEIGYWTTKNGERIHVTVMSTLHLINTIRML